MFISEQFCLKSQKNAQAAGPNRICERIDNDHSQCFTVIQDHIGLLCVNIKPVENTYYTLTKIISSFEGTVKVHKCIDARVAVFNTSALA